MKQSFVLWSALLLCLASCQKDISLIHEPVPTQQPIAAAEAIVPFTQYIIKAGEQFCDKNDFTPVVYDEMRFSVRFDSSAIYKTVLPANQGDINKLYGFSDNNAQHHLYSARFGWRWSNNALRLFGYIYNNGERSHKEIGTVEIGSLNDCSIKISGNNYVFSLNKKQVTMPRQSTTLKAEGYKLFPYFGGDELAPHEIKIWIKEQQ